MMQQMLVGLGGGPATPDSVNYFIIGSGGSGSHMPYGGGGSGQVPVQGTFAPNGGFSYTITIAAGASGGSSSSSDGSSSILSTVATGIGGLTPTLQYTPPSSNYGRVGAPNSSYVGGAANGGGGAGAGGNGYAGTIWYKGGNGGPGITLPIFPTSLTVGGGGGGGDDSGTNTSRMGQGADGGGTAYTHGAANRGGGGGAIGGGSGYGSNGGSGRVVLRYADSFPAATATTGSPTITVSGGYRHYDFTSSGSITF